MREMGLWCRHCRSIADITWDYDIEEWRFAPHAEGRLPCPNSGQPIKQRRDQE